MHLYKLIDILSVCPRNSFDQNNNFKSKFKLMDQLSVTHTIPNEKVVLITLCRTRIKFDKRVVYIM